MIALNQERDVIDLANRLGLTGSPVEGIINLCQKQIDKWVIEAGGVDSIDELELLVASKLNLVIEEIHDEADLQELKRRYVQMGEPIFAHIVENDLTHDTFGTMVRLKNKTNVAVIDCRDDKGARRFFTRWHEIAHLLVEPDCEQQVFRSSDEPLERLMDQIAGHVGFYHSIFAPLFESHMSQHRNLTFETVESIRQAFCPYASFQSTLFACHRRLPNPLLYIEARMGYTAEERRGLNQMRMFDEPEMKLRIQLVIPNKPASDMQLTVRNNMRVPETSIVYRAFEDKLSDVIGEENLKTWTFSKGGHLLDCDVLIQARRIDDLVMATIQPEVFV